MIRMIRNKTAVINFKSVAGNPTSIAIVRSKITVRKKVTSNTDTSLFGFFISERNVRHSLILYETIINTPARQAIGICLVNGPKKSKISNNTIAWMMPATGVRPPLLIFVMVRAIAPGNGNTAEDRYDDIGGPLCNQFGIGVMLVSCHTVGHRSGQQRFDCS